MECMQCRPRNQCGLVVDPQVFYGVKGVGKYDSLLAMLNLNRSRNHDSHEKAREHTLFPNRA